MVDAFVCGLRELLGDDRLVGVYRHGSEVLGGGGPRRDPLRAGATRGRRPRHEPRPRGRRDDDARRQTHDLRAAAGRGAGVSTDEVHSKLGAAEWALPRLPDEHRRVLERAVAYYRGERDDPPADVGAYVAYVQNAIRMASTNSSPRR